MSAADVEVVEAWFRGLRQGDPSPDLCDPGVVVRNWDESPLRGPYEGHDGLREWFSDFAEVIEGARLELKEVIDLGEGRLVTTQHVVGRFRSTGIDVDGPFGSIIEVRDGRILSATGYAGPGRAKKAAGLRPEDEPPDVRRYSSPP